MCNFPNVAPLNSDSEWITAAADTVEIEHIGLILIRGDDVPVRLK
jgi:hypothetical protein